MRSELRTFTILGAVIVTGLGVLNVALMSLDSPAAPGDAEELQQRLIRQADDKSRLRTAPDLVGIAHHLNTTPEKLSAAINNSVVLYDIWTYSCVNCIRTLSHITAWNEKYADHGLLIIGVHSPEFEFEKDLGNVREAMAKYGIDYPVVMDNDMDTWKSFGNAYWPRKYIADHEGYIRYDHIGEGRYQDTERVIQQLLHERAAALGIQAAHGTELLTIDEFEHAKYRTPEIYFGHHFAQNRNGLGSEEGFRPDRTVTYVRPDDVRLHRVYMVGQWHNNPESMQLAGDEGGILARYTAKDVNMVTEGRGTIKVLIDGMPIKPSMAGEDVDGLTGTLTTDKPRMYNIVDSDSSSTREIELQVTGGGFEIFTFTFG